MIIAKSILVLSCLAAFDQVSAQYSRAQVVIPPPDAPPPPDVISFYGRPVFGPAGGRPFGRRPFVRPNRRPEGLLIPSGWLPRPEPDRPGPFAGLALRPGAWVQIAFGNPWGAPRPPVPMKPAVVEASPLPDEKPSVVLVEDADEVPAVDSEEENSSEEVPVTEVVAAAAVDASLT